LVETWTTDLGAELAQRVGHPLSILGWRIPQAMPATDNVANAVRSFPAEQQCPTPPATQALGTDRPRPVALTGEANNMIPGPALP
jgi:hypothetical protein